MKTDEHIRFLTAMIVVCSLVCLAQTESESQKQPSAKPFDPVIERADVIYDDSTGLIPYVVLAADGDLIVNWTNNGDFEPGGKAFLARSSDHGQTWAPPYLTIASDNPLAGLQVSLHRLPDGNRVTGRLLRYTQEAAWPRHTDQTDPNFLRLAGQCKFFAYYAFSDDDGRTFTENKQLNDPVRNHDFAQGNIVHLPNGDLLWPWGYWGPSPMNGFKRSTDGGLTWSQAIRAWQDPPPGFDKPLAFNETAAAVCEDGSIVAVARVDGAPNNDKRFWQIISQDNGKTWSPPCQIEIAGGSPAMYCTPKGQLWLAYRDGGYGPGLGLAVSDDNGKTWRFLYHLKDPKGEHEKLYGQIRYTDEDRQKPWRPAEGMVGYPCFVRLSNTEVYVVYHAHNRSELPQRFSKGTAPFYVAGNLLRIPE